VFTLYKEAYPDSDTSKRPPSESACLLNNTCFLVATDNGGEWIVETLPSASNNCPHTPAVTCLLATREDREPDGAVGGAGLEKHWRKIRTSAAVLAFILADRVTVSIASVPLSSNAHRATRRGFGRGQ